MKLLLRSLQDYPPAMLRAIAEVNGLDLTSNVTRLMVEQVAGLLGDPVRLHEVLAACTPAAREALDQLLRSSGRSLRQSFERQHGAIRAIGPGRLQRERPHHALGSATEELWYRGLIYSAFAETLDGLVEFLYVPDDLLASLPAPAVAQDVFYVPTCQPPEIVRTSNDLLLHDVCTVLCLVQTGSVGVVDRDDPASWRRTSLYELARYSLQPGAPEKAHLGAEPSLAARLALTLASDLGWLQTRRHRQVALDAAAVRAWLDAPRDEQRRIVTDAWRRSRTWNDLCRTPAIECEDTGSWANDPAATRERLLPQLARLAPHAWYEIEALVAAVKTTTPDFQRSDGVYDTWYIRDRARRTYLRGFETWDAVEGSLLRFLAAGPLHWLGIVDLGDAPRTVQQDATLSDAGHPDRVRLTTEGHVWLTGAPTPAPPGRASESSLTVLKDYTVVVPGSAPLLDRFRVSRFTTWEPPDAGGGAPGPGFRYRITQSGLKRAAAHGIDVQRILAFLADRSAKPLPDSVVAGLQRWQDPAVIRRPSL